MLSTYTLFRWNNLELALQKISLHNIIISFLFLLLNFKFFIVKNYFFIRNLTIDFFGQLEVIQP